MDNQGSETEVDELGVWEWWSRVLTIYISTIAMALIHQLFITRPKNLQNFGVV